MLVVLVIMGGFFFYRATYSHSGFWGVLAFAAFVSAAMLLWGRLRLRSGSGRANGRTTLKLARSLRMNGSVDYRGPIGVGESLGGIFAGVLVIVMGVDEHAGWVIAMGVAFLALGGLLMFSVIPSIGKPVVSLSPNGFRTPLTPWISWHDVTDVRLTYYRGIYFRVRNWSLAFQVENLRSKCGGFALFHRIQCKMGVGPASGWIVVRLRDLAQDPHPLYRTARTYWERAVEPVPEAGESEKQAIGDRSGAEIGGTH